MSATTLFSGQTANASSSAQDWAGGPVWFFGWGTFGSGTLTFEYSVDGGSTYFEAASLTAKGSRVTDLPECKIRATLAGSSGANLNASWKGGARAP